MKQVIKVHNPAKDHGAEKNPADSRSYRWTFEPADYTKDASKYHALWAELHTKHDPTAEWFSDWLNRVPKNCGCDRSLKGILDELGTPDYTDWFAYSVRLHNAVNRKLSKPELSHDEARAIWQ